MTIKAAASILSTDFARIPESLEKCDRWGLDIIHCDVMDGSFVEPITFGSQMVRSMRGLTSLTLDCHLMVEHPQSQVRLFAEAGADVVTVHSLACGRISRTYLRDTLETIRGLGMRCGAVLNPGEDPEAVMDVLDICDMVTVMSVVPGRGGQKLIPETLKAAAALRAEADRRGLSGLDIEMDGGINADTVRDVVSSGVNVPVMGVGLFSSDDPAALVARVKGL